MQRVALAGDCKNASRPLAIEAGTFAITLGRSKRAVADKMIEGTLVDDGHPGRFTGHNGPATSLGIVGGQSETIIAEEYATILVADLLADTKEGRSSKTGCELI